MTKLCLYSLIILSTIYSLNTKAEYRAFELSIQDPTTNQSRSIISTLDDRQYPMYHHLKPSEVIQIKASWMCRQNTENFQPICTNPKPN